MERMSLVHAIHKVIGNFCFGYGSGY